MTQTPSLLFLGHHGSRTGAALFLLNFLQWLAENSEITFEVLLASGGELMPDYAQVAHTRVLNGNELPRLPRLMRRFGHRFRFVPSSASLTRHYPAHRFPVVYSNTVANGHLVGAFGQDGRQIICHAHEMKFAIEQWGGTDARRTSGYLHSIIAASNAVKRDLVAAWELADERVEVIHEFGQPVRLDAAQRSAARHRIRRSLNLADTDILVAMCGTMDWRKGSDIFLQLARLLRGQTTARRYHCVWIGAPTNRTEQMQISHDLDKLGVAPCVTIVGQVSNPQEYMSACDVFTLTSREDPCPLAMIEAATLAKPVICFEGSGGATDFIGKDAGVIVPYLDVPALAAAVTALARDPYQRARLGHNAERRASDDYSLSSQAPKLLHVIERHLRTAPARGETQASRRSAV